jgi:anti-sigma factor RsiW
VTALYAGVLVIGIVGLIGWVFAAAIGEGVEGWSSLDPESRFGRTGRLVLAAALGFGMGGMSASFAGSSVLLALVAAVAGAAAVMAAAWFFGPAGAAEQ